MGNNFVNLGKYLFGFIRWADNNFVFLGQYLFVFIRLATTLFIWGNIYLDLLGGQQQGGGEALQREAWIHCQ